MTKFVQIWVSLFLFWVCLCFCCFGGVVCFYGFFVCLFLKKNSGFMGLLKIELVTRFMGLFLRFIYGLVWLLGFILVFVDLMEYIWLVDLDLGFAGDWFISWI